VYPRRSRGAQKDPPSALGLDSLDEPSLRGTEPQHVGDLDMHMETQGDTPFPYLRCDPLRHPRGMFSKPGAGAGLAPKQRGLSKGGFAFTSSHPPRPQPSSLASVAASPSSGAASSQPKNNGAVVRSPHGKSPKSVSFVVKLFRMTHEGCGVVKKTSYEAPLEV